MVASELCEQVMFSARFVWLGRSCLSPLYLDDVFAGQVMPSARQVMP